VANLPESSQLAKKGIPQARFDFGEEVKAISQKMSTRLAGDRVCGTDADRHENIFLTIAILGSSAVMAGRR
jgi:hypothetical protein